MDVEAAGRREEVQKGFVRTADWTSKRREGTKKSKKREPEQRIGRQSGGKHGGSPKGIRKSGGLDVEAVGSTEEVQKGFVRAANWTLKRREGKLKSKRANQHSKLDVKVPVSSR